MRQIGFKNFRKFENFPSIELAPITVLVGENNAGKSTVVKGMLALSDFFNKLETDRLLFSGETSSKSLKKLMRSPIGSGLIDIISQVSFSLFI